MQKIREPRTQQSVVALSDWRMASKQYPGILSDMNKPLDKALAHSQAGEVSSDRMSRPSLATLSGHLAKDLGMHQVLWLLPPTLITMLIT